MAKRFGFRIRSTGKLARLMPVTSGDARYYELTDCESHPVYGVRRTHDLAAVLFEDIPCYNTSAQRPGWGSLNASNLEPVEIEITVSATPVEVFFPRAIKVLGVHNINVKDVQTILDDPAIPDGRYTISPALRPNDLSAHAMAALIGQVVRAGDYQREVVGIAAMTPHYAPDTKRLTPEDRERLFLLIARPHNPPYTEEDERLDMMGDDPDPNDLADGFFGRSIWW